MYSSKENVNQLTSLLVKYGVQHAVICPGSRNAPLSHNLTTHPAIRCYSVVDERSAGFYALGLSLQCRQPVAVCVTSGTALLNLAPAVAEAFYLHLPLIVISADRPPSWIDQQDGQTLPQPHALEPFVSKAVTLPEPSDDEQRWHTNRLINEALIEATRCEGCPVHINVPISEPLFTFNVDRLPDERQIHLWRSEPSTDAIHQLCRIIDNARCPMIIIGQTADHLAVSEDMMRQINKRAVVINEALAALPRHSHFDEALRLIRNDREYQPDCIVYLGGNIVSKRLKAFLRHAADAKSWTVNPRGTLYDTFCNLQGILECSSQRFLDALARPAEPPAEKPFITRWTAMLQSLAQRADAFNPPFSQMAVVKAFERLVSGESPNARFHYGNSASVRLGNLYARHHIHCNRGVNGIEGSLSTAAGASLATGERVYCVIGDLSFFYDQNALWNRHLKGNLRILLLNNGGGGIFRQLEGLDASPSRDLFVAASHQTTAEGICRSYHVTYLSACNLEQLNEALPLFISATGNRPVLLEVLTDARADAQAMRAYIEWLGQTFSDSHKQSSINNTKQHE